MQSEVAVGGLGACGDGVAVGPRAQEPHVAGKTLELPAGSCAAVGHAVGRGVACAPGVGRDAYAGQPDPLSLDHELVAVDDCGPSVDVRLPEILRLEPDDAVGHLEQQVDPVDEAAGQQVLPVDEQDWVPRASKCSRVVVLRLRHEFEKSPVGLGDSTLHSGFVVALCRVWWQSECLDGCLGGCARLEDFGVGVHGSVHRGPARVVAPVRAICVAVQEFLGDTAPGVVLAKQGRSSSDQAVVHRDRYPVRVPGPEGVSPFADCVRRGRCGLRLPVFAQNGVEPFDLDACVVPDRPLERRIEDDDRPARAALPAPGVVRGVVVPEPFGFLALPVALVRFRVPPPVSFGPEAFRALVGLQGFEFRFGGRGRGDGAWERE